MLDAGTASPVMVQVIEPAFTTTLPAVPPCGGTGGVTTIWPKVVMAIKNNAYFIPNPPLFRPQTLQIALHKNLDRIRIGCYLGFRGINHRDKDDRVWRIRKGS